MISNEDATKILQAVVADLKIKSVNSTTKSQIDFVFDARLKDWTDEHYEIEVSSVYALIVTVMLKFSNRIYTWQFDPTLNHANWQIECNKPLIDLVMGNT